MCQYPQGVSKPVLVVSITASWKTLNYGNNFVHWMMNPICVLHWAGCALVLRLGWFEKKRRTRATNPMQLTVEKISCWMNTNIFVFNQPSVWYHEKRLAVFPESDVAYISMFPSRLMPTRYNVSIWWKTLGQWGMCSREQLNWVPCQRDLPYEERLKKLDLPIAAYKISRGDQIETYKIVTGKYDGDSTEILFEMTEGSST